MSDHERFARIHAREDGLRRLRTLKRVTAVGAAVLAGLIALLAAATAPGKKVVRSLPSTRVRLVRPATTRRARTTHSSTQVRSATTTVAPVVQAPVQAPVQVASPPVAVSGGS